MCGFFGSRIYIGIMIRDKTYQTKWGSLEYCPENSLNIQLLREPEMATKIFHFKHCIPLLTCKFACQCSYNLPKNQFKSLLNLPEVTHDQLFFWGGKGEGGKCYAPHSHPRSPYRPVFGKYSFIFYSVFFHSTYINLYNHYSFHIQNIIQTVYSASIPNNNKG